MAPPAAGTHTDRRTTVRIYIRNLQQRFETPCLQMLPIYQPQRDERLGWPADAPGIEPNWESGGLTTTLYFISAALLLLLFQRSERVEYLQNGSAKNIQSI